MKSSPEVSRKNSISTVMPSPDIRWRGPAKRDSTSPAPLPVTGAVSPVKQGVKKVAMANMPVPDTERMLLGKPGVSTRDTTGSAADSSAGREVMSDQISPPIHSRPGGQLPGRQTPGPGEGSGRRG